MKKRTTYEIKAQQKLDDIYSLELQLADMRSHLKKLNNLRDIDPEHLAHTDEITEILSDSLELDYRIQTETAYLEDFIAEFLGAEEEEKIDA